MKKKLSKKLASVAVEVASRSVNTASLWGMYQPKQPAVLVKKSQNTK